MVYEKRIFIVVLALLVCFATAVWAGGQDDEAAAGKAELDFDTWMYNYEPWNGMIQTVVDKYMELNPNVIIKVRGGNWSETKQTLLSMAAAGDALDIMNLDTDWHVGIAAAGVLTDLREVAAPEQLADMNVESGEIEGTLFAVPTPLTHSGTYSNHELMDTYGLSQPVTWDDVTAGATKLKNATQGEIGYMSLPFASGSEGWDMHNIWEPWGFDVFPLENIEETGETGLDTPAARRWLEWRRMMIKEGLVSKPGEHIADVGRRLFPANQLVFYIDGTYGTGIIQASNPDDFGGDLLYQKVSIGSIPRLNPDDDDPYLPDIVHSLAIAEQSEHKEEAWKFVWYFLASDHAIENYTKHVGVTPSISQQQKHLASTYNNPIHRGLIENIYPYTRVVPWSENYITAARFVVQAMGEAAHTDTPIDEIIETAERNIKGIYGIQ